MKQDDPLPLWHLALVLLSLSFSIKLFLLWEYWGCLP